MLFPLVQYKIHIAYLCHPKETLDILVGIFFLVHLEMQTGWFKLFDF